MTTKSELRNLVLKELHVLPSGHTASAEQAATVEDTIDRVHAMLEGRNLLYWDTEDIPLNVTESMKTLTAERCMNDFMVPVQRSAIIMQQAQNALDEIRKQVLPVVSDEPIKVKYY